MTPKQADLIRRSFDAIWPVRRKIASRFYRCFFKLAPDAQRLFPNDMERQHLKLMDMIAAIVGALDEHELFQSIIRHGLAACPLRRYPLALRRVWRCVHLVLGT